MKRGFWSELSSLPKRSIESVILDGDNKQKITDDIESFINTEEEYWTRYTLQKELFIRGITETEKLP